MSQRTLSTGQKADLELVRSSGLFDEEFYLATYPDVAASDIDPATHFVLSGSREGRDPSAEFSTKAYADRYPDALRSGHEPLIHYLRLGRAEGRSLNPMRDDIELIVASGLFDEDYYRHVRPDLPDDEDPVEHYLLHGGFEGFDPSEGFSASTYMRQYEDVIVSGRTRWSTTCATGGPRAGRSSAARPLRARVRTLYRRAGRSCNPFPVVRVRGAGPRITVLTDSVGAVQPVRRRRHRAHPRPPARQPARRHAAHRDAHTSAPDAGVAAPAPAGHRRGARRSAGDRPPPHGRLPAAADGRPASWSSPRRGGPPAPPSTARCDASEIALPPAGGRADVLPVRRRAAALRARPWPSADLTVVVNTQRLLDHLLGTLPHLAARRSSFEPAFPGGRAGAPRETRRPAAVLLLLTPGERPQPVLARRPGAVARDRGQHPRPRRVELPLRGPRDPRPDAPPRGPCRHVAEGLDWRDYQALVSTMDAALVLMDTPHPSYPPLDLAAAGAAVLTNRHPGKEDLSDLSANILIADPSRSTALVEGLARVAALGVGRRPPPREPRAGDHIERDWDRGADRRARRARRAREPRAGPGRPCSLTCRPPPAGSADLGRSRCPSASGTCCAGRAGWRGSTAPPTRAPSATGSPTWWPRSTVRPRLRHGRRAGSARPSSTPSLHLVPRSRCHGGGALPARRPLQRLVDQADTTAYRSSSTATTSSSTQTYAPLVMDAIGERPRDFCDWQTLVRLHGAAARDHRPAASGTHDRRHAPGPARRLLPRGRCRRGAQLPRSCAGGATRAGCWRPRGSGWASAGPVTIGYFSGTPTHAPRLRGGRTRARAGCSDATPTSASGSWAASTSSATWPRCPTRSRSCRSWTSSALQRSIAEVEVNIAPLQHHVFTACKSELKYFEAAAVGTWTVASATPAFAAPSTTASPGGWRAPTSGTTRWPRPVELARDTAAYAARAEGTADRAHRQYGWNTRSAELEAVPADAGGAVDGVA